MNHNIRIRMLAGLAGALTLIGTLNAPLYAEEPQQAMDEIRAEVIPGGATLDQRQVLADSADDAMRDAQTRLAADIIIDLDNRFGVASVSTVASNNE